MEMDRLFADAPEFRTQRLQLRRLVLSDAQDVYEWASDPAVTAHTLWEAHRSIEDSYQYLESVQALIQAGSAYHWAIVDAGADKVIGRTGFICWDRTHLRTEVGFAVARPYWGRGIAVEAASEIIRYAFGELALHRIEGRCNHDNTGSARVLEKLGMTFEGILRGQLRIRGRFIDQRMYAVLRGDDAYEARLRDLTSGQRQAPNAHWETRLRDKI